MTNHYHVLVSTPEPDLSVGMWKLNQRHALRVNRRHGFAGHVFEGRFFAELVDDDSYMVAVARYIDQNPVRAGICHRAETWPWSGVQPKPYVPANRSARSRTSSAPGRPTTLR